MILIIVSSLIQHNYPYQIVKEVFSNKQIKLCISEDLFSEYVNVLQRDKFERFPNFKSNAQALLLDIKTFSEQFAPKFKLNLLPNQDDNKLLELAETAKANFLITGNHKDFPMRKFKVTQIFSPKKYWEEIILKNKETATSSIIIKTQPFETQSHPPDYHYHCNYCCSRTSVL